MALIWVPELCLGDVNEITVAWGIYLWDIGMFWVLSAVVLHSTIRTRISSRW